MDPRILLGSKRTWQITPHPFPVDTWMRHMHKKQHDNSLKTGFPGKSAGKECLQCGRPWFDLWVGKIPWRREWLPIPVFWPGEFHGLYSLWGHKELDMTEQLHFQKNDSYFFKSLFFNWRIIPLPGCVAFCSTTMWFRYKYIYVPSLWSALHPNPIPPL